MTQSLYVNNVGYHQIHPKGFTIYRPHGSGDYLALLIKSKALFMIQNTDGSTTQQLIQPNTFYLYKMGTIQHYQCCEATYINDYIHFSITPHGHTPSILEQLNIPCESFIRIPDLTLLSQTIRLMSYEWFSNTEHKEEKMLHFLSLFLYQLHDHIHLPCTNHPTPYREEIFNVRSEIYNNPGNDWNITSLSERLSLSKYYFQRLYHETTGIACGADIINARMEFAKYNLSSSQMPVHNIASLCGYANDVHFMRQFKQQFGMTPTEYRKLN